MPCDVCPGCVLIVDDEADVREALREHVQGLGCNVLVAADGAEALETLGGLDVRPCLIVTDLDMPNVGGADLARHVRATGRHMDVPILTMSAEPNRARPVTATGGHLDKPFSLGALDGAIVRSCAGGPARCLTGSVEP